MATLRERKRRAAMERIQHAAYEMLARRGLSATTVADVAEAAGVSPSTVYRYFGTKQGIFLWDPLEAPVVERLGVLIADHPPLQAVERALTGTLDALDRFEADLEELFESAGLPRLRARVTAAAVTGGIWAAIDEWRRPGAGSLAEVTGEAVAALRSLQG